jgi:transposase
LTKSGTNAEWALVHHHVYPQRGLPVGRAAQRHVPVDTRPDDASHRPYCPLPAPRRRHVAFGYAVRLISIPAQALRPRRLSEAHVPDRASQVCHQVNVESVKGFAVPPKHWIVERTISCLNRCCRLAKDWECLNRSALAFPRWASVRIMPRKLCPNQNMISDRL